MKSFSFPLQSVLEARRAQEDEARQQLADALEKQRAALARSREALQALNQVLEAISSASSGRFTVADRDRSWSIRQAQEKICAEMRIAAQECARVAEEKRVAVLQRRRDRELLERLKSARRAAWHREAALAEQNQFYEFAMTRRHQAAQQEHALC
jgi:flagellar export protein FliJ